MPWGLLYHFIYIWYVCFHGFIFQCICSLFCLFYLCAYVCEWDWGWGWRRERVMERERLRLKLRISLVAVCMYRYVTDYESWSKWKNKKKKGPENKHMVKYTFILLYLRNEKVKNNEISWINSTQGNRAREWDKNKYYNKRGQFTNDTCLWCPKCYMMENVFFEKPSLKTSKSLNTCFCSYVLKNCIAVFKRLL